jgi:hypothetical protein
MLVDERGGTIFTSETTTKELKQHTFFDTFGVQTKHGMPTG